MERRIAYDAQEGAEEGGAPAPTTPPAPNALRGAAGERRERGRGSYRYTRETLARALGLRVAAVYSAERRGELQLGDLCSVAKFIARRLAWQERRERKRLRDIRRKMSVKVESPGG